jgi:hypothetical protein
MQDAFFNWANSFRNLELRSFDVTDMVTRANFVNCTVELVRCIDGTYDLVLTSDTANYICPVNEPVLMMDLGDLMLSRLS